MSDLRDACISAWLVVAAKRWDNGDRDGSIRAHKNAALLVYAGEVERHRLARNPRGSRCGDCATCCG